MGNTLRAWPFWSEDQLVREHRTWLSSFRPQYLRNWEKLANNDYEAALFEAAVRRWLKTRGILVEPNEELTGSEQRPDFRCTHRQDRFFVEVACIPIAKAMEETGLPHPPKDAGLPSSSFYKPLNDPIFKKCGKKNSQCSGTDLPTLLAVGTFHHHASILCIDQKSADMLLTGETYPSFFVNTATGSAVGESFLTTKFYSAVFLRPGGHSLREARTSLSGLLLCGFGCNPPKVLGVLHPAAMRPFDRRLLAGIDFGELKVDLVASQLRTCWARGGDE
jgi:hypothetical protein